MRPNNRQRSRGGRNGGGGGGGNHTHKPQHIHNPNRPPNRNQLFDSSGPDVRVRGNAHQVFDKYQALAREAAAVGDRIQAEAYWQYADHYYRLIQTMGGFVHRNNWGDGEEGQQNPQQQNGPQNGQQNPQQQGNGDGYGQGDHQNNHQNSPQNNHQNDHSGRPPNNQQNNPSNNQQNNPSNNQQNNRPEEQVENEPGLGGVAFLQSGRSTPSNQDPAAEDQPEVPEFRTPGRRGGGDR